MKEVSSNARSIKVTSNSTKPIKIKRVKEHDDDWWLNIMYSGANCDFIINKIFNLKCYQSRVIIIRNLT